MRNQKLFKPVFGAIIEAIALVDARKNILEVKSARCKAPWGAKNVDLGFCEFAVCI